MQIVSVPEIISPVNKPFGDAEGDRVGDDVLDLLPSLLADFAGARVEVDLGDLADEMGETRTDTSDGGD